MDTVDISSIILTCDSYTKKFGCIEHAILSLLNQKNVKQEIIVVDNSKLQPNQDMLEKFIKQYDLTIRIVKINTSIAKARNFGAKQSKGKILVFIDEDTLALNNNALEIIINNSKNFLHGYGARRYWTKSEEWFNSYSLTLKKQIKSNNYSFIKRNIGEPSADIRKKLTTKYLIRSFIGNFGYIEKESFHKVHGFPEIFQGYGFEDDALSFLCYSNFGKPASLENIETVHITHSISPICYENYQNNQILYNNFLNQHNCKAFHIGDLLYPEIFKNREVLEYL